MRIYGYLRASTKEQDAKRAKKSLEDFARAENKKISAWFIENESGATLQRPELFRLLDISNAGDVILVEQIDRISRLNTDDWEKLKFTIKQKNICIVSLDLPTSHQLIQHNDDEFTQRMVSAVNSMLLDMLAAISRKDYTDRRRRQSEGVKKARENGKYRGRQINHKLHENISILLQSGKSYSEIVTLLSCSRSTIAKISKNEQGKSLESESRAINDTNELKLERQHIDEI
jgi:DNA invertase Pin-like site-specific DNA recombinase